MGNTGLMTFPWNFFQSNERKTHENLICGNSLTLKTGLQKTMHNVQKNVSSEHVYIKNIFHCS